MLRGQARIEWQTAKADWEGADLTRRKKQMFRWHPGFGSSDGGELIESGGGSACQTGSMSISFSVAMHKYILLLTLSVSCIVCAGCGTSETDSQPIRKTASVEPDSALPEKLGERHDLDFGSIQLPPDFTLANTASRGKSTVYQFGGPRRDDGTAASLQITTVQLDDNDKIYSLGETLDKFLGGIKKRRNQWSESELLHDQISGYEFAHKSWEGVDSARNVPMKGVSYVTYIDKLMVSIASQDIQPMADETIPLVEAAIRTFKQKEL